LQQFHVMMISLRILDNTSQRKHGSPARRLREQLRIFCDVGAWVVSLFPVCAITLLSGLASMRSLLSWLDASCCSMSIVSSSVSTIWHCLQRRCDRGSSVTVGTWPVSHFPDDVSSSSIMSSPPLRSPTCCDHGRVRVASENPNNITSVIRYHQQNL